MIIAFSGDWHLHCWPQFSRPWKEGLNSRVKHIYEVVGEWLPAELEKRQVRILAHLGDWNQNSSNDYRLVNLTREAGYACEAKVERAVALHGNHDTVSTDPTDHNAFPYFAKPMWNKASLEDIAFVPVGYNTPMPTVESLPKSAREKRLIFLLHRDIEGGVASNGFIYRTQGQVTIAELLRLKKAFPRSEFVGGHYHSRQAIGKLVRIVGAPVQHRRDDENSERGFTLYDTDKNEWSFVPANGPRFVSADLKLAEELMTTLGEYERERVYVSITVGEDPKDYARAEELVRAGLCATVKIASSGRPVSETKQAPVTAFASDEELLEKWFIKYEPSMPAEERAELIKIAGGL